MTTNELRAKFEMWCAEHARNLSLRKGSGRVYWYADTLQAWELWLAAHASRDAEVEALRKRINDAPVYYVPTKKPDSEDGWLQVISSVKALNDMRGKHVRLVIDAAMREEEK